MMRIFGIDVTVHWSWFAMVLLHCSVDILTLNFLSVGFKVSLWSIAFFAILGHELSHSLAAKDLGFETEEIILHCLGGAAMIDMEGMKPSHVFLVSAAGPAFNISSFFFGILLIMLVPISIISIPIIQKGLTMFLIVNLLAGLFNLVPIWPLDGGRMLRAGLEVLELEAHLGENAVMNVSHAVGTACLMSLLWAGFVMANMFMMLIAAGLFVIMIAERVLKDSGSPGSAAKK